MKGYCGRLLKIDLNSGSVDGILLNPDLIESYLGGSGIGARLLYDLLGDMIKDADPLGPENPLIFMTGPFSGTTLPSTARMTVSAISPLTGLWGEANVGGYLGAQLKFAGYDGLVITGASEKPVYLYLDAAQAKLQSAADLWGKETYEATDFLQERHALGSRKPAVAVIGPAGEKGVLFASIAHNKGHHFGRSGMGAVMGAKKLKALVVSGSGQQTPFDPDRYKAVRQRIAGKMKESMLAQVLNLFGTNCATDTGHMAGDVPVKNWQIGEWHEGIAALNGPAFDEVLTGRATCYACPVACKRVVEVKEGPFRTEEGPGPEYETITAFGTMCMIPDAAAVSKINDRCNKLGLDTISCGCSVAFAMDCYDKGLLSNEETGGLELKWGRADVVLELLEQIGKREGFGAQLADGSYRLAEKIGGEAFKYLSTVKRMEAPMHDPRAYHGIGLAYATSIRGACHESGIYMAIEHGIMEIDGIGLERSYIGQSSENKAKMVQLGQDFGMAFSCAALVCNLGGMIYNEQDLCEALSAVTGKDWTPEEIVRCGRRIWMLKRAVNLLRGAGPEEDRLPGLLLSPVKEGGAAGSVPEIEQMMKEYYALREFDDLGYPSAASMIELGLDDVLQALNKSRSGGAAAAHAQ